MKIRYFYFILIPLLISYVLIPHELLWNPINYKIFKLLNNTLYLGKPFQILWALLNNHWNDWVIDLVFVTCFIAYIRCDDAKTKLQKSFELILIAISMALTIFVINKILFRHYFPIQVNSPSVNFKDFLNINTLVPFIKSKVYAYGCFPGDHATTALLFYFLTRQIFPKKITFFLSIYTPFLILPRLILGAHNFSDILLGSLPIAFSISQLCFVKNFIPHLAELISVKIGSQLFKNKTSPL